MKKIRLRAAALAVCICNVFMGICANAENGINIDFSSVEKDAQIPPDAFSGCTVSTLTDASGEPQISIKGGDGCAVILAERINENKTDSAVFTLDKPVLTSDAQAEISFGFSENGELRSLPGFLQIVGEGKRNGSAEAELKTKLMETDESGNLVLRGRGAAASYVIVSKEQRESLLGQRIDVKFVLERYQENRLRIIAYRKLPGEADFAKAATALSGIYPTNVFTWAEKIEKLMFNISGNGASDKSEYSIYALSVKQQTLEVESALPQQGQTAENASITFNADIDASSAESAVSLYCEGALQTAGTDYEMNVSGRSIIFSSLKAGKEYTADINDNINKDVFGYTKPAEGFSYSFVFNTTPYSAVKTIKEDFEKYAAGTALKDVPTFSLSESNRTTSGKAWKNDLSLTVEEIGGNKALRIRATIQSDQNRAVPVSLGLGTDIVAAKQEFSLKLKIMESEYDTQRAVSFFPAMSYITGGDVTNMKSVALIYGREGFNASGLKGSPKILTPDEREAAAGTFTELCFNFGCDGRVKAEKKKAGEAAFTEVGTYQITTPLDIYNAIAFGINTYKTDNKQAGATIDFWVDDISLTYTTPPMIKASNPQNGALDVNKDDNIEITLTTPLNEECVNSDNIHLKIKGEKTFKEVEDIAFNYTEIAGGSRIVVESGGKLVRGNTYVLSIENLYTPGDERVEMKGAEEIEFTVPYTIATNNTSAVKGENSVSFTTDVVSALSEDWTLIAVLRNSNNAAVGVKVLTGSGSGTNPLSGEFTQRISSDESYTVTFYLWNGLKGAKRLGEVKTVNAA